MNNGIVLALLAYASYAWSDAAIKALGGGLSVFEIGFFQSLIAGICIYFTKPSHESWHGFWRMKNPIGVQSRALFGLVGSVLGVVAFTSIPLAEVYAIVFLSPLFVTVLSMLFLKERVGPWRWLAIFGGFVGVLLVVRPGFREIEIGHVAAVAMAVLGASTVILMRALSSREQQTTMLGFLILYGIAFNAAVMAFTSAKVPTIEQFGILLIGGVCVALGHTLMLRATRFAAASHMATTHYSQMVWAVVLGAFIFNEQPDVWTVVGLAVIAGSGMLTMVREQVRLGVIRWNRLARNRL